MHASLMFRPRLSTRVAAFALANVALARAGESHDSNLSAKAKKQPLI
jgi:hypothetical protein